tara:strand:+ start:1453 stop:2361 length:909 start_codon:yes stop_codon:yes gene_type:complete
MNVLSLFDGISGAMLALQDANIKVEKYFASEIDKHCIAVSKHHFPNIIQLGDVKNINLRNLPKIDLLIGGSPCQDLSNAFKGSGLKGDRSSLFFDFKRIKQDIKPKFFLLENVKNKWKEIIDDYMGEEGVIINSYFFTAQSRPRCYWTNIQIDTPNKISDQRIIDIMEKGNIDKKYFFDKKLIKGLETPLLKNSEIGIKKIYDIPREILKDNERQRRVYSIYGKSPTLLARSDTAKIFYKKNIRKLTPLECERLQGIKDNYTSILSDTQRYKAIGNGFTIPVISNILKNIGKTKKKQLRLFK